MRRTLVVLATAVGLFSTVLLSGCFTDPDDPTTWLKQLDSTPFKRKEALVNLYRIYETGRALSEKAGATGDTYKKKLARFRSRVNPTLVKSFDKKVRGKYEAPQEILEHLIMFDADEAAPLFMRVIKEYIGQETDKYGDEDTQEGLVAKSLAGLGRLASRKKMPPEALDLIGSLIEKICAKAESKGVSEGLDPRSFIRNAVVKAVPDMIKGYPEKSAVMGKFLSTILNFGFAKGEVQDPMVNIFAGWALRDVGDTSPKTIESLVTCLFRKGRGRAFHPYCTVSLAKLPAPGGTHPAVEPLLLLARGDPWSKLLRKLNRDKKKNASQIESLQKELTAAVRMPPCPNFIPAKYRYVCDVYWTSRKEKWEEKEPGVVELNSIITLREIGDLGKNGEVMKQLLKLYGSEGLQNKWFASIEDKKDRWLPGTQMQRMQIKGYGRDMNIRLEFLYAAGRMGAVKIVPALADEFIASMDWSKDPGSLVKAAEAIARSPYDPKLVLTLIQRIKTVDSWMGHIFKHRMFKHASWAKVKKQCMAAETEIDKKWNECMEPGDKTDEQCFDSFAKDYWIPELKKLVGFFEPNDVREYRHPICLKGKPQSKDLACKENPTPEELKKGLYFKCTTWGPCDSGNFYTCLDGDQELRLQYAEEASKIVTQEHVKLMMDLKPEDFLRRPRMSVKDLPKKDTTYYDPTDLMLAKNPYAIVPKNMAKARRAKAIETIDRRLCYMKRRWEVVQECKSDIRCYIETLKGNKSWTLRDCREATRPIVKAQKICWRHQEKAATMLGILGKGNTDAIRALCEAYKEANVSVREAILLALDRTADSRHANKEDMGQLLIKVADDETDRRVKGVWQINRDARACVGRMNRRKP